jgi:mono/diheme cytochrome c family protein
MKTSLCFLLCLFMCSLFLVGSLSGAPQSSKTPDGEEVYKTNCTRCHNTPPSLNERQARVVVAHMRVRANLTERDATAVMHYLAENARSN